MSETRIAFTFQNQRETDVDVVVEPWALSEKLPAGAIMVFEVNAAPAPEIEFSISEEGQPFVYVMSERVTIRIGDELRHDFHSVDRPPPIGTFRVLNKLLWGKRET